MHEMFQRLREELLRNNGQVEIEGGRNGYVIVAIDEQNNIFTRSGRKPKKHMSVHFERLHRNGQFEGPINGITHFRTSKYYDVSRITAIYRYLQTLEL